LRGFHLLKRCQPAPFLSDQLHLRPQPPWRVRSQWPVRFGCTVCDPDLL